MFEGQFSGSTFNFNVPLVTKEAIDARILSGFPSYVVMSLNLIIILILPDSFDTTEFKQSFTFAFPLAAFFVSMQQFAEQLSCIYRQ